MSNLVEITKTITLDSLEVAKMLGIKHWEVLRKLEGSSDRKGYIQVLTDNQMVVSDYFIESTYTDESGKENKCYLFTKMGCEFIANKFTGEKGVLFTAKYVRRFNDMEKAITKQFDTSQLSPSLQMFNQLFQSMVNTELEQKRLQQGITEAKKEASEAKQAVESMRDVITLNPNAWRADTTKLINAIAKELGGFDHIKDVREESYKLLDERAGAKLGIRLTNRRRKVLEETGSKSKADKVSKLDVIADDKRLTEVYIAIVKEMAIKYKVA